MKLLLVFCWICGRLGTCTQTEGTVKDISISDNGLLLFKKTPVCFNQEHRVSIANDTLATSICKALKRREVGLAFEMHTKDMENQRPFKWISLNGNSVKGERVTDIKECGAVPSFMEIACFDGVINCEEDIVHSFIRKVCSVEGRRNATVLQCKNRKEYYRVLHKDYCYFTHICSEKDDAIDQTCGCPGVKIVNGQCASLACEQYIENSTNARNVPSRRLCDGYYHCKSHQDEEGCPERSKDRGMNCTATSSRNYGWVPNIYICDSYSDCKYGEDEIDCGYSDFGLRCNMTTEKNETIEGWVDKKHICDKEPLCVDGSDEDEGRCKKMNQTVMNCWSSSKNTNVNVKEIETCVYPYSYSTTTTSMQTLHCDNNLSQLNCTSADVLNCTVRGFINTRVRVRWLCNNWEVCDDGRDELCEKIDLENSVHKHLFCDGQNDTKDGADERDCVYTNRSCTRFIKKKGLSNFLPIPEHWICDGVVDCSDGLDEDGIIWGCNSGIICPNNKNLIVPMSDFCDGEESCGGAEALLCSSTHDQTKHDFHNHTRSSYTSINGTEYEFTTICVPGLIREGGKCSTKEEDIYFLNKHYKRSTFYWSECNYTDLIWKRDYDTVHHCYHATLNTDHATLNTDTLGCMRNEAVYNSSRDHHKLNIWYKFDRSKRIYNTFFNCRNRMCVPSHDRCNHKDDCGDSTDENDCPCSFYCNSGYPKSIALYKTCDGVHDCADSSDECSTCAPQYLLSNLYITSYAFIMGLSIISLNSYIIFKGASEICKPRSGTIQSNQVMIIGIAVADWFMGVYLFILFIYDRYYGQDFCESKFEWLTSSACATLGVISTSSSMLSLLIMATGGIMKILVLKGNLTKAIGNYRLVIIVCMLCAGISLTAACIPFSPSMENYFKNGIYYPQASIYPTLATRESHLSFIRTYKELLNDTTETPTSWQYIDSYVSRFCIGGSCEQLRGKPLHFYGNHKTCLFKYLIAANDPQRTYCHVIEGVMLFLFSAIVMGYIYIFRKARSFYKSDGMVKGAKDWKDHVMIHVKVSLVTVSNLLIWAPFLVICLLLKRFELQAHTEMIYYVASIVVLPINSFINPIITSNFLQKFFKFSIINVVLEKLTTSTSLRDVEMESKNSVAQLKNSTIIETSTKICKGLS